MRVEFTLNWTSIKGRSILAELPEVSVRSGKDFPPMQSPERIL